MFEFLISLVLCIVGVINAEQCRRDPVKCQNLFMLESGWTRSIFAIKYLGKPVKARQAILEDAALRRKVIIEFYVLLILLLVLGFLQIWN